LVRHRDGMFKKWNDQNKILEEQKQYELRLKQAKFKEAEKERLQTNQRRIEAKRQAQRDFDNLKKQEKPKYQPDSLTIARQEANESLQRDRDMGYTEEQIRFKHLDKNTQLREQNREALRKTNEMLNNTNRSKFKTNLEELIPISAKSQFQQRKIEN